MSESDLTHPTLTLLVPTRVVRPRLYAPDLARCLAAEFKTEVGGRFQNPTGWVYEVSAIVYQEVEVLMRVPEDAREWRACSDVWRDRKDQPIGVIASAMPAGVWFWDQLEETRLRTSLEKSGLDEQCDPIDQHRRFQRLPEWTSGLVPSTVDGHRVIGIGEKVDCASAWDGDYPLAVRIRDLLPPSMKGTP